jgi:hypothetical protein
MHPVEQLSVKRSNGSSNSARYFFESFLTVLIFTFLPFKAIGFAIPFIFLGVLLLRSRSMSTAKRLIQLVTACGFVLLFYYVAFLFETRNFILSNGILSFINYSSFLILFLLPPNVTSEQYNYERYVKVILPLVAFEGIYGTVQRILSAMRGIHHGDLVEGTISPFSVFIGATSGFGNQFFAMNMIFLLTFCFPYVYQNRKGMLQFAIGLLGVLLASVGHVFYSLVFATVLTLFYFEARTLIFDPKRLLVVAAVPTILLVSLAVLDENVFNDASRQARNFLNGETPKSKAIRIVFTSVADEYPSLHLIGLGPGQYSSRAGIIASGQYGSLSEFFTKLPFLNLGVPEAFKEHVLIHWNDYKKNSGYGNSTMNRPFLSLLSVYAEYGPIIFAGLLLGIGLLMARAKSAYKNLKACKSDPRKLMPYTFSISMLFLVMIGVYENYYEVPQGIFVGILLIYLSFKISTEQPHKSVSAKLKRHAPAI